MVVSWSVNAVLFTSLSLYFSAVVHYKICTGAAPIDLASLCTGGATVNCAALPMDQLLLPFIINYTISLVNCTFLNCPQLQLTNGRTGVIRHVTFVNQSNYSSNGFVSIAGFMNVTIENCSFIVSNFAVIGSGGALTINNSIVRIKSSTFLNCQASQYGGAIYGIQSQIFAENTTFDGCSATNGGAVYMDNGAQLNCRSCDFQNTVASSRGGAIFLYGPNAGLTWSGGSCINTTATFSTASGGGCIFSSASPNIVIENVVILNSTAKSGSVFYLQNGAAATLSNVSVSKSWVTGQAGCLYSYSNVVFRIFNSSFDGCKASGGNGGFAYVQSGSSLHLVNSIVTNSFSSQAGGTFYVQENCTVNIVSSTISGSFAGTKGGIIFSTGDSVSLLCDRESLLEFGRPSAVCMESGTTAEIRDCKIANNSASPNGGAFFLQNGGRLILDGGAVLEGNIAASGDGGAIYAAKAATILFRGDAALLRNNADGCGGAFAIVDATANVTFASASVEAQGNTALRGPLGCIYANPAPTIVSTVGPLNESSFTGKIWIDQLTTGLSFIDSGIFDLFPGVTPYSRTTQISLSNETAQNFTINIHQSLPNITAFARDLFGNLVPFDGTNPTIVQLTPLTGLNSNVTLSLMGESVKAVVDRTAASVTFSGIYLSAQPGSYSIMIGSLPGTADHSSRFPWPVLSVTVSTCHPYTELYFNGDCYPIRLIGSSTRLSVGLTAGLLLLVKLAIVSGLVRFRRAKIVMANSSTFLIIACVGCSLGVLSVAVSSLDIGSACVAQPWFDNVGFTFVFSAILLKTYRIRRIFDTKNGFNAALGKSLQDSRLLRYFGSSCILMCSYLAAWTVCSPPFPQANIVYNSFATADRCAKSSFSTVTTFGRLLIQVGAVWLAFNTRNIWAEYNESRFILFATYNWAIFGAAMQVLAEEVIVDPQVGFVIRSISVLMPNVISAVLLGGVKVFECVFRNGAVIEDGGKKKMINVANVEQITMHMPSTGKSDPREVQTSHT